MQIPTQEFDDSLPTDETIVVQGEPGAQTIGVGVLRHGVLSIALLTPPVSPAEGDKYLMPVGVLTGAWTDFDAWSIAEYRDAAWVEITPNSSFRVLNDADDLWYYFDGATYVAETLAAHTHSFASLTSKPTTLAGYGISDAASDAELAAAVASSLQKSGGTMTGAIRQTPGQVTFAAAMSINVASNNQFQVTEIVTSDFALTLTGGQGGDCGTIAFKQAAVGGKKLTGITVAGWSVKMDASLDTLNTDEALVANAHVVLTYQFVIEGGDSVVYVNVLALVAAAYT